METTTAAKMIQDIEKQASSAFGYSPTRKVTCPHCGGIMQAIDAKAHVRTAK